jgi:outer membrane protein TolC
MADRHAELKTAIAQLHEQLADVERLDDDERERLRALVGELRDRLDSGPGESVESPQSAVEDLSGWARRFEQSHPDLSGAIGGVIDAIARLGI